MSRYRLICDSPERIRLAEDALRSASLISNDIETWPYRKTEKDSHPTKFAMILACFSCSEGDFAFPLQNRKHPGAGTPFHIDSILSAIRRINALPTPQVGQNFGYDVQWYLRYGLPVANWAFDTMVMFWSRWPELPKDIAFICSVLLDDHQYWKEGLKSQSWEGFLDYGMDDTARTLTACEAMIPWLIDDPAIRRNFVHGMLRCQAAASMNAFGSAIDERMLESIETELRAETEAAESRLRYLLADPEFNVNSPKQKAGVIYDILGAQPMNAKGKPVRSRAKASTGQVPLRLVKQGGVVQKRIVEAMEAVLIPGKQISNIVQMPQLPLENGHRRFLTFFDGVGTITERFASRGSTFGHGGNAQNLRKKYRRFMRADPGHFLLEVDLSGADAVYVGFEAEEQALIDCFVNRRDVHANTASLLFKQWSYDDVVAGKKADDPAVVHPITGVRQISKKVGHGSNYLMANYTMLMTSTVPTIIAAARADGHPDSYKWSLRQLAEYCGVLENRYRNGYPRLRRGGSDSWYHEISAQLRLGYLDSIYGFRFHTLGDPKDEATLRVGAAFYGQSNTAGRCNAALYELAFGVRTLRFRDGDAPDAHEPALRVTAKDHGIRIVRQVHDSLTFQCDASHPGLAEGLSRVFHVFHRPFVCKNRVFALGIDAEVSTHWAHDAVGVSTADDILEWLATNPEVYDLSTPWQLPETPIGDTL